MPEPCLSWPEQGDTAHVRHRVGKSNIPAGEQVLPFRKSDTPEIQLLFKNLGKSGIEAVVIFSGNESHRPSGLKFAEQRQTRTMQRKTLHQTSLKKVKPSRKQ